MSRREGAGPWARPERLTSAYARKVTVALGALLVASLFGAALVGSVPVSLSRALDFSAPGSPDFVILFRTRIPRVLLGAFVGGGLAAAGAALQALLRNALASPDVIGVSGGASVGAVLAIAVGGALVPWFATPLAAFLGSLGTILLIVRIATIHGRLSPLSLLLVGVIVNTIASSLILLVSAIADALQTQGILFWLAGSLAQRRYDLVAAVGVAIVAGTTVLWTQARPLNLLSLGEETAAQLGTDVQGVRRITFLVAAFVVGVCVAVSGIIGFVGLIVPHILRLAFGPDLRLLIPASFLGGGAFLVLVDAASRAVLAPTELPVGVLTALSGGPFFIFLLRRRSGGVLR